MFLLGLPALYYRLLRTDANTRTLANRTCASRTDRGDGEFRRRHPDPEPRTVPIRRAAWRSSRRRSSPRKVGVNLGITPRIHPSDEVTLR
jgi:hypothetical protein